MSRREVLNNFNKYADKINERLEYGIENYRKGEFCIKVTDKDGNPVKGATIDLDQKTHEFKYGANIFMLDELETPEKNEIYKKYFADAFNMATLPFYWNDLEPVEGKPRYEKDSPKIYRRPAPDLCIEYCEEHGIEPREHALAYEFMFPEWAKKLPTPELKKRLTKRFKEISERYADKIPTIEVTNEMWWGVSENTSAFYEEDDYVEWCFKEAEKYFPNNQLVINDFTGVCWGGFRNREAYYTDVRKFLDESEVYYNSRVDKEIERNRKDNFEIVFVKKNGEPIKGDIKLDVNMNKIDFNFGANIFMLGEYDTEEENKRYEEKFLNIFNSASIPLYWEGTEPQEGYLRYDADTPHDVYRRPAADYVADFCMKNNIEMKGHPLFWHEFVPKWLPDNYQTLKKHIVRRFNEISERYADIVPMFDVVNEPSRIYDCYMRDRYGANKILVPEDDYCVWLFRLARDLFPTNKLILNDTVGASFAEFRGKYSGYYLNIKDLLSRGVEIDEIGMQCHLGWWDCDGNVYNSEHFLNILDTYASLGKTINISEISIPSRMDGVNDEELQADAAERLYKAAFSHEAVTGLTWWNLPDDGILTTKRVAGNENLPSAGLIDPDYNEKPAYKRLRHLIKEEWTTNESFTTSTNVATFRGFYGKYDVTAVIEGKEVKFEIDFSKSATPTQTIII